MSHPQSHGVRQSDSPSGTLHQGIHTNHCLCQTGSLMMSDSRQPISRVAPRSAAAAYNKAPAILSVQWCKKVRRHARRPSDSPSHQEVKQRCVDADHYPRHWVSCYHPSCCVQEPIAKLHFCTPSWPLCIPDITPGYISMHQFERWI